MSFGIVMVAVFPAQIIERSPVSRGFLPRVDRRKAFSYLFPDEDAALLACIQVALVRRLLYGVLAREGLRFSEAMRLSWRDLDLRRGIVRLDTNKTQDPRAWALHEGVVAAVHAWRERYNSGRPATELVFLRLDGTAFKLRADDFRRDLSLAGVVRHELFERTIARRPIRLHDLRATFVTIALATGRTETWVADRTGHRSSEMINRYRRPARSHRELGLGELVRLADVIPELG